MYFLCYFSDWQENMGHGPSKMSKSLLYKAWFFSSDWGFLSRLSHSGHFDYKKNNNQVVRGKKGEFIIGYTWGNPEKPGFRKCRNKTALGPNQSLSASLSLFLFLSSTFSLFLQPLGSTLGCLKLGFQMLLPSRGIMWKWFIRKPSKRQLVGEWDQEERYRKVSSKAPQSCSWTQRSCLHQAREDKELKQFTTLPSGVLVLSLSSSPGQKHQSLPTVTCAQAWGWSFTREAGADCWEWRYCWSLCV